MEQKTLEDLKANPNNPRTLSRDDAKVLSQTLVKYGDLSGFVFNVRTGMLVCGHMRTGTLRELPGDKQIVITERLAEPSSVGTVATGYVLFNGEKYAYREVDWDEPTATAAGIAANHIHGDDDDQLLAEANYMLQQNAPDLLALTGQDEKEIAKSLKLVSGADEEPPADENQEKPEDEKMTFVLTPMQSASVRQALDRIKQENGLSPDDHGTALFIMAQHCMEGSSVPL